METVLEQNGWHVARVKGSHHIVKKDGMLPTLVPVHAKKVIKPGLLRSIEKATGIKLKK